MEIAKKYLARRPAKLQEDVLGKRKIIQVLGSLRVSAPNRGDRAVAGDEFHSWEAGQT